MLPAPPHIDGADVLYYTVIDHRHRYTGNCRHTIDGVELPSMAGLAICRHEAEDGFYLFGCDAEWQVLTDTWHETPEDAREQAEFEYEGVSATWQTPG